MEYGAGAGPREIAEFLVLDRRMPRSLAFCVGKLRENLRYLHKGSRNALPSLQHVDQLERMYLSHDIGAVFDFGLHEFIQHMIEQLSVISRQIEIDFRFYE